MADLEHDGPQLRTGNAILLTIAAAIAILHILTNGRYGFHRDELQFLSDARHLDWGFVAYPPVTPFLERISLQLFGISLTGLRLFSVIAQSTAIVVTGLMARELGGGRLAQIAAAMSVAMSALPIFEGTEFQYSSFDYLWWVLIAYFIARLLTSEDARWWLAIGAVIGVGLETKYSILFFIAGILGGLILTPARRYFMSRWFWAGVAIALLIFLPNFLWQASHGFISERFLQHIHTRDVCEGRADGFLVQQFYICAYAFATPLWIAGLIALLRSPRYRMMAWMYLIPLALFYFGKGRSYYLAAAYPMLFAMGAVAGERWIGTLRREWSVAVPAAYFLGVALCGGLYIAMLVPLANSGSLRAFALKNSGDLREEIGWDELVKTVAGIRDSLPPDQQQSLGIFVGNYGEQGAIEILGPAYHLPPPISLTNSAWLRGYPTPQPTTLIVLGYGNLDDANQIFTNCRLAGHNGNSEGVKNEESQYSPDIFVCGPPRQPWPEFWATHERFG
jgi:hypothetical protein